MRHKKEKELKDNPPNEQETDKPASPATGRADRSSPSKRKSAQGKG